jgi:hypothetical protein
MSHHVDSLKFTVGNIYTVEMAYATISKVVNIHPNHCPEPSYALVA